jgi:hypothetical protein
MFLASFALLGSSPCCGFLFWICFLAYHCCNDDPLEDSPFLFLIVKGCTYIIEFSCLHPLQIISEEIIKFTSGHIEGNFYGPSVWPECLKRFTDFSYLR